VVLDWRQNRVIGKCTLNSPADQVSLAPFDANVVCASGENFIGLWTARSDGELLQSEFDLDDPHPVIDHAWIQPGDGTLAVCTGEGTIDILSSKDMAVVSTIEHPFEFASGDAEELKPLCIRCFYRGFAVGGPRGTVAFYEMTSDGDAPGCFAHVRTIRVRHTDASICCIDTVDMDDIDQMRIVFGFDDAHIAHTSMGTLMKGLDEMTLCTVVAGGFHSGAITSLDLAAQRPIIASMCQEESSVRIWNYTLRRCELCCSFPGEELTSIAIHPFGFFLAVSFSDKLRFFQILVNELKPYRELSNGYRGIRLVKFSHGGHLLAAAQGKLVLIVNTTTLQRVATLRGHSQHVTSLCFDPQDQVLLTCGEDGSLFAWSTAGWQKTYEHFARSAECLAIAAGRDGYSCCSLIEGNKTSLKSLDYSVQDQQIELPENLRIGALCYQQGEESLPIVLAGTSTGMLWICRSPLGLGSCDTHGLHADACSAICLSADGRTVVTAGDDGIIFVLNVSGIAPEAESSRRETVRGAVPTEIVMINRGEIQVRQEEFQLLDSENGALQSRLTEEASKLEGECKARLEKARKKDQEEIALLRQTYEGLQKEATQKERENLRELKTIESAHMQAADQMEVVYDKKITAEADRYLAVESTLKTLEKRIEVMREDSEAQLEQVRLGLQEDLRRQVSEKEAEIQKLKDLLAFSKHRFDTMLDQEGMEFDYEVAELKRKSQDELEQQRMVEYKLKKEQDTLLRGLDKMEHDREQISKDMMESKVQIKKLTKETTDLERNVEALKGDRRDREATLRDRELQIGAYKVKVNTLKKFKHVLDFRLREVQESLQPKEKMIERLNEDLINLEAEFEKQLAMQHQMESELVEKDEQITALLAEGDKLRETIKLRERRIQLFHTDLYKLVKEEQDVRSWPQCIRVIYRDHMNPECIAKDAEQSIPMEELRRQTKLMEKKIGQLAANKAVIENKCKQDIQNKTTENSLLIHELNMLRVERKTLQRQVKDLQLRVHNAELKAMPALEDKDTKTVMPALASSPSDPGMLQLADLFGGVPNGSGLPYQTKRPMSGKTKRAPAPPSSNWPARSTWQHAGGDKKQRPDSHIEPEARRRMQQLLVKADLNQQQIEMQSLENKILRDQVEKLESTAGRAATLNAKHAAGAAHKAVRQAAR